jgi:predicted O-linked N-acetylglucosamine transferase (SPINDLY family)
MGVPTVSLMGEGMSERLSGAILNHAGYGGLVAASVDDYVALAIRLASVPDQLTGLRRTVRDKIRRLPLGDPARFALDFYELIGAAVAERLGLRSPI